MGFHPPSTTVPGILTVVESAEMKLSLHKRVIAGLVVGVFCLGLSSCGHSLTSCEEGCEGQERCVYVHDGKKSGYFCAVICSTDDDCPDNLSCSGSASSCKECFDHFRVCK